MKSIFFAIAIYVTVASCGSGEVKKEATENMLQDSAIGADTSSLPPVAVKTVEHFFGKLPCADCEGINTEISVVSDGSYLIQSLYEKRPSKGPGSNEVNEEGKWMMHGDTLHLMNRKDAPSLYIKTDSSLIQLDMKGNRITGKLADKYILKKS